MLSNCSSHMAVVKDYEWQSPPVDVTAIGTRTSLSLRYKPQGRRLTKRITNLVMIAEDKTEQNVEYAVGMRIDQGPSIFSRSIVMTFTPRYKIINRSKSTTLEIQQENEEFILQPNESKFLKGRLLRLRVENHMWTEYFEMEAVGDLIMKVQQEPRPHPHFHHCYAQDNPKGAIVQVSIQLQDPMILVSLRCQEELTVDSFYLIRNECTQFKVMVWQKNCSSAFPTVDCVLPYTTLSYVPDQYLNCPTLCLQIQSTLLYEGKQLELNVLPVIAIANVEVTLNKPHRLPIIHVGRRRIWIDVVMEGTTKVIVVTDVLPGTSTAHLDKRQAMLLQDWKRIINCLGPTVSMVNTYARAPAVSLFDTVHQWNCNLRVVEGRRFDVLATTRDNFSPNIQVEWAGQKRELRPQNFATSPIWLPLDWDALAAEVGDHVAFFRIEIFQQDSLFGSRKIGFMEMDVLSYLQEHPYGVLDVWCPLISCTTGQKSSACLHLLLTHEPFHVDTEIEYTTAEDESCLIALEREIEILQSCQKEFQRVLTEASLDVSSNEVYEAKDKKTVGSMSSSVSISSDETFMDDKKELSIIVMNVSYLDLDVTNHNFYCAMEFDTATRCTNPATPKPLEKVPERKQAVLNFSSTQPLGLDLVYNEGRVKIHAIHYDGQCGSMLNDQLLGIGDIVSAVNSQSILNLSKDTAFAAIERAKALAPTFTLAITPNSWELKWDVEWNRRVIFEEMSTNFVKILLYRRDAEKDYGLSAEKESSVLPFLYFFGEDTILDTLNPAKQHTQQDDLVAMCWLKLPDDDEDVVSMGHSHERVCALYQSDQSDLNIVGTIRLAAKWQVKKPDEAQTTIELYAQIEVKHLYVSFISDIEVILASLSGSSQTAGIQLSYGTLTDSRQIVNVRMCHLQIDNQLLDTNYPVLLSPVKSDSPDPIPTFQGMIVVNMLPSVMHFEYIFAQVQELEVKLEDFVLVAIIGVFSGINWSAWKSQQVVSTNPYDLLLAENIISDFQTVEMETNKKVVLRWLLLCPIKLRMTFSSTTDRPLTHSILSPNMSPLLRNFIGAAAALVTNLDRAPIEIPEFFIENVFETKYTLGYYIMQHYVHFGLRSWYKIIGSVDVLGNPIGLVSTLGTGVKDFFFTPAQMLLEDESGLRIDNLRTGMTKGSKSLLRNTAVGVFHTTGKITETLGKGLAMLAMDTQYNVQRQQRALRQASSIGHIGDGIVEGGKDLAGGIWQGVRGVVVEPVVGAATDGASGFIVGLGKGFAGLVVKPTAGVLDLLNSISQGVKVTAESIDTGIHGRGTSRIRLPRRIEMDGVLVAYSQREAKGSAIMLLSGLQDDYVYHIEHNDGGIVLLTDKRICCLSKGHQLWEVALDSTLQVQAEDQQLTLSRGNKKLYAVSCTDSTRPQHFQVAVDTLGHSSVQDTRYLLLNLEQNSETLAILKICKTNQFVHFVNDVVVSFTVYRLLVLGGPYQWTVFRRYSEFRDFHERLLTSGVNVSVLPSLPGRQLFFSTSESIVKHRKEALGIYLQVILMHPFLLHTPDTIHFLTHDASDIQVAHAGLS
ncbi:Aste57867_4331 [Aphanomyces stellatus]|uniref:Aste57867_4331 protein n=1 Tax=Aphanomyces stellatus TaxID=120398 RepID=A0A485KCX0_9STRA|nr:hypothetical protein As57867_004320 [Aphanomyces stellatus]VFT81445.1 Aste57867_4331 [Aphanomyces stellatus]